MRYVASENKVMAWRQKPPALLGALRPPKNGYKLDATQISRIAGRSYIKVQTARH